MVFGLPTTKITITLEDDQVRAGISPSLRSSRRDRSYSPQLAMEMS
jgi:hypothetical protein